MWILSNLQAKKEIDIGMEIFQGNGCTSDETKMKQDADIENYEVLRANRKF